MLIVGLNGQQYRQLQKNQRLHQHVMFEKTWGDFGWMIDTYQVGQTFIDSSLCLLEDFERTSVHCLHDGIKSITFSNHDHGSIRESLFDYFLAIKSFHHSYVVSSGSPII